MLLQDGEKLRVSKDKGYVVEISRSSFGHLEFEVLQISLPLIVRTVEKSFQFLTFLVPSAA